MSNQQLIAVWMDGSVGKEGEFLDLKEQFRTVLLVISKWIFVDNDDDFHNTLTKHSSQRIILIISGSAAKRNVHLFSSETNIHSVYIFCGTKENYEYMRREEPKIRGIFNVTQNLLDAMKTDLDQEFSTPSDSLPIMSDTVAIAEP